MVSAQLGIAAFAFPIYFDFSGYSDMAISLGKMFGFDFPENFDRPRGKMGAEAETYLAGQSPLRDGGKTEISGVPMQVMPDYRQGLGPCSCRTAWVQAQGKTAEPLSAPSLPTEKR